VASECLAVNRDKIVHETVDGEVIIINLDTGTYYSLVETGLEVWRGVEQGASRAALVEALTQRYAADRATVATAVDQLVDELIAEEIVIVVLEQRDGDDGAAAPVELSDTAAAQAFTPPLLTRFTDMSDLLLLDPIHDVDEQGWPSRRPE
jgi:hypothetical protein